MSSHDLSRRRAVWSRWVPLAVTVLVATLGAGAWAWTQRGGDDDDDDALYPAHLDCDTVLHRDNPAYRASDTPNVPGSYPTIGSTSHHSSITPTEPSLQAGWGQHMSGALRRTPSPQQILSNASKTFVAGVGAVGAAMGSALAAIREEDKHAFADHEAWSEEAEAVPAHKPGPSSQAKPRSSSKRRKTVAVVVSADTEIDDVEHDAYHEQASILSHVPRTTDLSRVKLLILIYSPALTEGDLDRLGSARTPGSLPLSASNSGHDQVQSLPDGPKHPARDPGPDPAFEAVYSQAVSLVEKESMIIPFTTRHGHIHILRHLQPEVVYLQASLAGDDGGLVTQLQTWMRHDIMLVVGADGGHGGLADSESEVEKPGKSDTWWKREDRVGRGRDVVVVDTLRMTDDWTRRIQGAE